MTSTQDYNMKIAEAVADLEKKPEDAPQDDITLSNGVVFGFKKINVLRIQTIMDRFEYPEVPKIHNEDKGRWEENPNDPKYVLECQKVDAERSMAVLDAVMAFGTYVKSLPDTVIPVDDDTWIEELEVINIPVNTKSKLARYLAWVKFVAVVDAEDMTKVAEQFGMSMGISEGRIKEQLGSNFPDQQV
jgi:hypothetical protein